MARFAWLLPFGSAVLVLAVASPAHAHGSSSSDSGSSSDSSGSSDSGSTDTGTGTGGTADSSTTEACGDCEMQPGNTMFDTPNNGANVDAPFDVQVSVVQRIGCDCTEQPPMYVQLYVDEEPYGEQCTELSCSWSVDTTVGGHMIFANAVYGDEDYVGMTISVFVQHGSTESGTPGTSSESGPPPSDDTTTTGPASDGDKGGCSCTTDRSGGWAWLAPLALVLRRRRRS